ncbi:MAG TPA: hypothetical protein VFE58_13965 [Tepidisphaeraceae bacterium]|jgi:hypothetical protein|nr:hypothetical protein [Tepidisphaeraceae bacterium]
MSEGMYLVRAGEKILNLAAVSAAHWDQGKLYVYFSGGRFQSFEEADGRLVWDVICRNALDLRTGELKA